MGLSFTTIMVELMLFTEQRSLQSYSNRKNHQMLNSVTKAKGSFMLLVAQLQIQVAIQI
jgi:hypothetical protein